MSRVLRPGSLVLALWLVVLWTLLWGGVTLANVLGGAVVVGVLLVAVPRPHADAERPVIRPFALVSLIVWFAWKLVEANVAVAIEVLRPPSRSRIRTAVVRVDLPGCPTGLVTAIANFITLTPGTLTLEVAPAVPSLYVHVLVFDTAEQVRDDVYEIERRIVAAVGSVRAREVAASRAIVGAGGAEGADGAEPTDQTAGEAP